MWTPTRRRLTFAATLLAIFVVACEPATEEAPTAESDAPEPESAAEEPGATDTAAPAVTYSMAEGGDALVSAEGTRIPLESGVVDGYVGHWKSGDGTAEIAGWAADVETSTPAETIVVARDGEIVLTTPPNLDRDDVGENFGDDALVPSGYQLQIPASDDAEIRVFAVVGDTASELPYAEGFPWLVATDDRAP